MITIRRPNVRISSDLWRDLILDLMFLYRGMNLDSIRGIIEWRSILTRRFGSISLFIVAIKMKSITTCRMSVKTDCWRRWRLTTSASKSKKIKRNQQTTHLISVCTSSGITTLSLTSLAAGSSTTLSISAFASSEKITRTRIG
jgi:hypothetical protein